MHYPSPVSAAVSVSGGVVDTLGRAVLVVGFILLVVATLVVQFLKARDLYEGGESLPPGEQVNCTSCGARIPSDADNCTYCAEAVTADS
jgi:hypothetical protein